MEGLKNILFTVAVMGLFILGLLLSKVKKNIKKLTNMN